MRTDVLTGPAPWAVSRLGGTAAAQLWTRIPTALATAVARAAATRDTGPATGDQQVADVRWPVPYEELSAQLGGVEGAWLSRAPRGGHPVVVVRDQVLLPWCYGPTGATSMRDTAPGRSVGRLARELLRAATPAHRPPPNLPGGWDLLRDGDFRQAGDRRAGFESAPRVLVAGFAWTAGYGLLRVCLGQAAVTEDGELTWEHVTDLPLPPPSIPRPRPQRFP